MLLECLSFFYLLRLILTYCCYNVIYSQAVHCQPILFIIPFPCKNFFSSFYGLAMWLFSLMNAMFYILHSLSLFQAYKITFSTLLIVIHLIIWVWFEICIWSYYFLNRWPNSTLMWKITHHFPTDLFTIFTISTASAYIVLAMLQELYYHMRINLLN